jgi:hypothetical protein
MYIIKDSITPVINEYLQNQAFKNCMIRYWPHTTTNGVVSFGRLYTWIKGPGVQQDDAHIRIYNKLGMTVKSIAAQNHSHLDNTYFYLKAPPASLSTITEQQVQSYIEQFSPLIYLSSKDIFNSDPLANTQVNPDPYIGTTDSLWDNQGWISVEITYQPTSSSQIDNQISDAMILSKIGDTASIGELHYGVEQNNRLAAFAMLDRNNVVFQTQATVESRNAVSKTTNLQSLNIGFARSVSNTNQQSQCLVSAQILFKFRRTTDVSKDSTLLSSGVNTYLNFMVNEINSLITNTTAVPISLLGKLEYISAQSQVNTSMFKQLAIACNFVNTYHGSELIVTIDKTITTGYYPNESLTTVSKNTLSSLPPKEFRKEFLKLMTFGYHVHKKKGHWYDVVVEIVILVVAIAVLACGQFELTAGLIATVTSMTALAEVGWAMYLVHNGGSPGAIQTALGISNVLGIIAMIDVFVGAIRQIAVEAAKEALTEAAKAAVTRAIIISTTEAISSGVALAASFGLVNKDVSTYVGILSMSITGIESLTMSLTTDAVSDLSLVDKMEQVIVDKFNSFVSQPLSDIMNQTIHMLNAVFNVYISIIAPPDKGNGDLEALLKKSQAEVENTNPENSENMWNAYTDPYGSIFEMGDMYDKTYPMLTDGINQRLMNQCYYSGF